MIWTSWQEFLAMGGYGWYVWGSMGGVACLLALEVVSLRLRARSITRRLASGSMANFNGAANENTA